MRTPVILCVLLLLSIICSAITINTAPVGDPGNAADTRYSSPGYGSVGYAYNIGKYEVTAGQYAEFLNAVATTDLYGLYNTRMGDVSTYAGCNIQRSGSPGSYTYSVTADWARRPVNYVSFWDACRFVNWMSTGSTEIGAYTLGGYNDTDGRWIQRNSNWKWAVTNENEWYKAAFYKSGGTNAGYWDYATQSNSAPVNDLGDPTDPGNNATYYDGTDYTIGLPSWRTEVGSHENSESAYGTFDQGGNVWELNEAIPYQDSTTAYRGERGGGFYADLGDGTDMSYVLRAYHRTYMNPLDENFEGGFRVVQSVPEPASLVILACGMIPILALRRRKA